MDIIAQEFKTAGNIGALARVMKNFGFSQLILYKPQCDHLGKEAMDRATHAKEILENARIVKELDYDLLIGATAITGTDRNLKRNPITPETLSHMELKGNVGLIIGREADGMRAEELAKCDIVVTIPTSKKSPTMNVSHAAAILLYELYKCSQSPKQGDNIKAAAKEDKERLLQLIDKKLDVLNFATPHKTKTQQIVWKKLIGKTPLSKREVTVLFGFMKKIR